MELPEFRMFPAKVMMFGEYVVLHGGSVLALPLRNFYGQLSLSASFNPENINPFIQSLGTIPDIRLKWELLNELPLDTLIFTSNIPIGYGLGSSGALTASVFDAFVEPKARDLFDLREDLAHMESFFHGTSSGIDPLISFLDKGLVIKDGEYSLLTDSGSFQQSLNHFFLIDSQQTRKTGPLVEKYKTWANDSKFVKEAIEPLKRHNEEAIRAFLDNDQEVLNETVKQISELQFRYFREMIPGGFDDLWEECIDEPDLSMKLCGAGGGGYLLVYAANPEKGGAWLDDLEVDYIEIVF